MPLLSVTVRVTILTPKFAQVKLVGGIEREKAQASLLPPFMSRATMLALPPPSNDTVMFWHSAVGAMLSTTVTVALQVLESGPWVAVSVTVLAPKFAQVKKSGLTDSVMPPAGVLPSST